MATTRPTTEAALQTGLLPAQERRKERAFYEDLRPSESFQTA